MEEAMNDLCFSTFVYGWYQDLTPLYIYSILKHFPQHYVKVYTNEFLTPNNKRALDIISHMSGNFEIVERFSLDHPHIKHLAAFRFLMPPEEFSDFRYVYLGDVDIIAVNQFEDDFVQHYVGHMKQTGLPFSNSYSIEDSGKKRLTGLHFIEVEPYYEAMKEQIARMEKDNEFIAGIRDNHSFDEEMLYEMCDNVFDLGPLKGYTRTHHGTHLGYFRIKLMENGFSRCNDKSHRPHPEHGCPICNIQAQRGLRFPKPRNRFWDGILPTCIAKKTEAVLKDDVFPHLYQEMGPESRELIDRLTKFMYKKMFL
jgi:hypothetical protein